MAEQNEQPEKKQIDLAQAKVIAKVLPAILPYLLPILGVVVLVVLVIFAVSSCTAGISEQFLGENIDNEGAVNEKDADGSGKFIATTDGKKSVPNDGAIAEDIKSKLSQLSDEGRVTILQKVLSSLGFELSSVQIEELLADGVESLEQNLKDKLNFGSEEIDDVESLLDIEFNLDELANFLDRNSKSGEIDMGYNPPMLGRRVLGGCGFAVCYGTFDTVYPAFKIDFNYAAGDLRLSDRSVYAVTDGEIVFAGLSSDIDIHPNGDDAGYQILLLGDDGYTYYYAHLLPDALDAENLNYAFFANNIKDQNKSLDFSDERDTYFFEDYLAHSRARVEAGEVIGFMDASGTVDGRMKLHFGISDVWQNDVDPRNRLGFYPTGPGSIRDVINAWLADKFVDTETGELTKIL